MRLECDFPSFLDDDVLRRLDARSLHYSKLFWFQRANLKIGKYAIRKTDVKAS